MKINKFIETSKEGKFINIDFIVSIQSGYYGYYVTMCDGKEYEINNYDEALKLFNFLKSQQIELKGEK